MAFSNLLLILGAVFLGSLAQLLLKAGTNSFGPLVMHGDNWLPLGWKLATNPMIAGGIFAYGISLIAWIFALSRVEVSVAYPMVSIGYVLTAVAAWHFLGESLTPIRIAGIGVIVLGVFMVARSA